MNFAVPVLRSPAGSIEQSFGTPPHGADTACDFQQTVSAAVTLFPPDTGCIRRPQKRCVQCRDHGQGVKNIRYGLNAGAAGQRQDCIRFGRNVQVGFNQISFTLPLDRFLLKNRRGSLIIANAGEFLGKCFCFTIPTGEAYRNTASATEHKDMIKAGNAFRNFFNRFEIPRYHCALSPCMGLPGASRGHGAAALFFLCFGHSASRLSLSASLSVSLKSSVYIGSPQTLHLTRSRVIT